MDGFASLDGSALLAMSDFLDPRAGPQGGGEFEISPSFFVLLLLLGFAVGMAGHIVKSKVVVALGVLMVFAATVLLPVAIAVSN